MYLVKLAFDNLRHNVKRTLAMIIIIAVATMAIILYQGYVEYSKEGMTLGFIQSTGDFQIALTDYWNNNASETHIMNDEMLKKILAKLKGDSRIDYYDCVYDFSGIVGNENSSAIFWGKGFDRPEKQYSAKKGASVFGDDENCVLLGEALAQKIGLKEFVEDEYVSLLTNSPESGMSLCSVKVNGFTNSGVLQNDSGLLICSRKTVLDAMEVENSATYIQVFLRERNSNKIKDELANYFSSENIDAEIRTWKDLNPSFEQINKLNEFQFYIISVILCVLIFIALLQSVSTSLFERLGEFGTLEAIGLKKKKIIAMLLLEVFYLVICGLLLGLLLSLGVNTYVKIFDIKMVPPGYTEGYSLLFYFSTANIIKTCLFVTVCCFLSVTIPVVSVYKNSVNDLIHK